MAKPHNLMSIHIEETNLSNSFTWLLVFIYGYINTCSYSYSSAASGVKFTYTSREALCLPHVQVSSASSGLYFRGNYIALLSQQIAVIKLQYRWWRQVDSSGLYVRGNLITLLSLSQQIAVIKLLYRLCRQVAIVIALFNPPPPPPLRCMHLLYIYVLIRGPNHVICVQGWGVVGGAEESLKVVSLRGSSQINRNNKLILKLILSRYIMGIRC